MICTYECRCHTAKSVKNKYSGESCNVELLLQLQKLFKGQINISPVSQGCPKGFPEIMKTINFKPIGIIHTPFKKPEDMPIQPTAADGVYGSVELFPEYIEGLQDVNDFSHIYLIYHFHLSHDYNLKVIPFLDNQYRGLFSTRAPKRPNPIGLSIVKLLEINENIIEIENVDIIDGTPLIDIKPYVPEMDAPENCKIGWLTNHRSEIKKLKSDKRFAK